MPVVYSPCLAGRILDRLDERHLAHGAAPGIPLLSVTVSGKTNGLAKLDIGWTRLRSGRLQFLLASLHPLPEFLEFSF